MDLQRHWESVYHTKSPDQTSWYQPHLHTSIEWILCAAPSRDAAIIDIGAGQSTLVDDLLAAGYRKITALDISAAALARSRDRLRFSPLAAPASKVRWITADISQPQLPPNTLSKASIDLWHDRAVFHFLTEPSQRAAYLRQLTTALRPGGQIILATFAPNGPETCSGLPVRRYSAQELQAELGPQFQLEESADVNHNTPFGTTQPFVYCRFRPNQN